MAKRAVSSPLLIDWLPVLVLPPVLVIDAVLSAHGKPLDVANVLAAFAGTLPLVLRRRLSFPALAPLLVGGVVLILWLLHPQNTVVLIPMVALLELALNGDRPRSLQISLAVVPCVVISVVPFATGFAHVTSIVVRNLVLCLLAIAVGEIVRSRRLSTRQLLETREQETLRRVSEERLRIAREIHDVVAHAMTAINVQAGVAAHLLEREPGQAYDALRHIKATSGEALTELRSTLDVLRDPSGGAPMGVGGVRFSLDDLEPLTGGLRCAGIAVDLDVDPCVELPAAVHTAGYRIVQEALTNVARHAGATTARVTIRRTDRTVTIEVVDNGETTATPATAATAATGATGATAARPVRPAAGGRAAGNGLRGMRERAAALGGTLEAAPVSDGGWQVRARLPLAS